MSSKSIQYYICDLKLCTINYAIHAVNQNAQMNADMRKTLKKSVWIDVWGMHELNVVIEQEPSCGDEVAHYCI